MNRRKARIEALKILYGKEIVPNSIPVDLEAPISINLVNYQDELINCVEKERINIDNIIRQYSHQWQPERMNLVDVTLLRIAIAEFYYIKATDTTKAIIINEAIELARLYSSEEAVRFINGVLNNALEENQ